MPMFWDEEMGWIEKQESEEYTPKKQTNQCKQCRYYSALLSDKPNMVWCVELAKHVSLEDDCCDSFDFPRKFKF